MVWQVREKNPGCWGGVQLKDPGKSSNPSGSPLSLEMVSSFHSSWNWKIWALRGMSLARGTLFFQVPDPWKKSYAPQKTMGKNGRP